ncbi:hypothetical protein [Ruegeria jejuensis]
MLPDRDGGFGIGDMAFIVVCDRALELDLLCSFLELGIFAASEKQRLR